MNWRITFVLVACAAALTAQAPPVSVLEVDTANRVQYVYDTYDPLKFARTAAPVAVQGQSTFMQNVAVADIVAINGKPARGTVVVTNLILNMTPNAAPGYVIADLTRSTVGNASYEIQRTDGRPIGTFYGVCLSLGTPPPGAPAGSTQSNQAVVGGTGAFAGVRGTVCQGSPPTQIATRVASVQENPADRRNTTGGTQRFLIQVFPMYVPEIIVAGGRPAVFHADGSPVTESAPACAGEQQVLMAAGLGPTEPVSKPEEPFTAQPMQEVTSPVEVIVNGMGAKAIFVAGWPGSTDRYFTNFRVPEGTKAGVATLQLSVAWVKGPEGKIPIR